MAPSTRGETSGKTKSVAIPRADKIKMFPEILVNDFSENSTIPDISETKLFFLTKCDESFAAMLEGDFLFKLEQNHSWRWVLVVSNLTFGCIKYNAAAKTHLWNSNIPQTLVDTLREAGKIIVLQQGIPLDISLLSTEDQTVTVICTANTPTAQRFKLEVTDKTGSTCKHIGTTVTSVTVFPEGLNVCGVLEELAAKAGPDVQKIKDKLVTDPTLQLQLNIKSSDKLVDLWYMKFLRDCFKTRTHVTKEFAAFVKQVYSELEDCVASDNADGKCRFHYDCCDLSSNEECVPGKEWALEFEVEVLGIGPMEDEMLETESYQIPFIHDKV